MIRLVSGLVRVVIVVVLCVIAMSAFRLSRRQRDGDHAVVSVEPPFVVIDATTSTNRVAAVQIVNRSTRRVHLLSISSSCGCTVAEPPEREFLLPGESSRLQIQVTPPETGQKATHVDIETDFPDAPRIQVHLLLKGKELPVPRLVHSPDTVTLQADSRKRLTIKKSVAIETIERSGSEFWLTIPRDLPNNVQITAENPDESDGSQDGLVRRSYPLTIASTIDPDEPFDTRILLTTTTGQQFPLRIIAEYVPPIKPIPGSLFLDLSSNDASRQKRTVLLVHPNGKPQPEINFNSIKDDWLTIRRIDRPRKDSSILAQLEVSVEPDPALGEPPGQRTIRIETSHPDCPVIEIPVVIKHK